MRSPIKLICYILLASKNEKQWQGSEGRKPGSYKDKKSQMKSA